MRWTAWLPIAFYVGAVVLLTATVPPQAPFGLSDKVIHGLEFFGLAFLTVRGFSLQFESPPMLPAVIAAIMLGVAVGASDELVQSFAPLRTSDFADLLADTLGAVFGACFGALFFLRTPETAPENVGES